MLQTMLTLVGLR